VSISESKYDMDRAEMAKHVPTSCLRVLDVGCDTGRFGALLRARGGGQVEVFGVEVAEVEAEHLHEYSKVWRGYFPDAVPSDQLFDCVVMNDVLEHMVDPWDALESTRAMLERGGSLVGSVPNVRHISVLVDLAFRGTFQYRPVGIMDVGHLRFFTRSTLRQSLVDAGFVVTTLEGINIPNRRRSVRFIARYFPRVAAEFLARQIAFVAVREG